MSVKQVEHNFCKRIARDKRVHAKHRKLVPEMESVKAILPQALNL